MSGLLPQHRADLKRSGLTDATIAACRFRSIQRQEKVQKLLGWNPGDLGSCLVFPFFDAAGEYTGYSRLKPDRPRKDKAGRTVKYESPRGESNHIFLPPNTRGEVLQDTGAALVLTEGEKKSASADQAGFPCVGLTGVWAAWVKRQRDEDGRPVGDRQLIDDLAGVAWEGRTVCLCYDSDAATNPHVRAAEMALAKCLSGRGAVVRIVRLPAGANGEKTGLDDFLVAQGADALRGLLEAAPVENGVRLTSERAGSRQRISVHLWDELIFIDCLDPTSARARAGFTKEVCKKLPGADAAALDAELLALAVAKDMGPAAPAQEIDVANIVRPDQFFTPTVAGLTVPVMTLLDGAPLPTWQLFLRWSTGEREQRDMVSSLELAEGDRLFLHPTPGEPALTAASWSMAARSAWLAGESDPDPLDVYRGIRHQIERFVELPPDSAAGTLATLSLWVMHTYCFRAWPATPYLSLSGPLGSGKSTLLSVQSRLVYRPLVASSMSAASMFRTLNDSGGCVLLDEAERLRSNSPDQAELLAMLLAGYRKEGRAVRLEAVGDSFRPVSFSVFSPKAMAAIAQLPPALSSRCIRVPMQRSAADSKKPKRRIDAAPGRWQALRDDLHAIALNYGSAWIELAKRRDVVPDGVNGRDYELWQPLLALAAFVQDHGEAGLLDMLQAHALQSIDLGRDDSVPDTDETLLELLAEHVQRGEQPTPGELLQEARVRDVDAFTRWSPRGVSARLANYGVRTKKTHGRRAIKGVTIGQLATIQDTYAIDLGLPPKRPTPSTPSTPGTKKQRKGSVKTCTGVDEKAGSGVGRKAQKPHKNPGETRAGVGGVDSPGVGPHKDKKDKRKGVGRPESDRPRHDSEPSKNGEMEVKEILL